MAQQNIVSNKLLQNRPRFVINQFKKNKKNKNFTFALKNNDSVNEIYILLTPQSGLYKNTINLLELKMDYGNKYESYQYPISPPFLKFITKIFHPNISVTGLICVDILKERNKWVPQYDFISIMNSILLLLDEPNNSSPFNGVASSLWTKSEKLYKTSMLKNNSSFKQDTKDINNILSIEECEKIKDEKFTEIKKNILLTQQENKTILDNHKHYFKKILM